MRSTTQTQNNTQDIQKNESALTILVAVHFRRDLQSNLLYLTRLLKVTSKSAWQAYLCWILNKLESYSLSTTIMQFIVTTKNSKRSDSGPKQNNKCCCKRWNNYLCRTVLLYCFYDKLRNTKKNMFKVGLQLP